MTYKELRAMFTKGKADAYAWPGAYQLYYVTTDGAALCPGCVTKERAQIFRSTHNKDRDGWALAGRDINYEDNALYCDHCSKRIPSAYAEDDIERHYHANFSDLTIMLKIGDAQSASHAGGCDDDVRALARLPYVAAQLAALDAEKVRRDLRECGAWSTEELNDEDANLRRLLWIAACDIKENFEQEVTA